MKVIKLFGKNQNGYAMVIVLVLLVFLFPIASTFLYRAVKESTFTRMERRNKTATTLANNVLVDLMRQFSQSYYSGHYDSDSLSRNEMFYEVGFSTVTIIADSVNHYLYITALGKYGKDVDNPLSSKRLYAVIQFISDLTTHNFWCNTAQSWGSGVNESGKDRVKGNVSFGGNCTFNGPFICEGNVTGNSSNRIKSDLYCTGSFGSVTVDGGKYPYVPEAAWPSIDVSYYNSYYSYKCTSAQTIQFNSDGTFTVVGSTIIAIPSDGAIIFGQNCNLTVYGTVHGRVTVVASGTQGSSTQGNIYITNNLNYANGTNNASNADSIAILAHNYIYFNKTGSPHYIHGATFSQYRTVKNGSSPSSKKALYFYGTMIVNQGVALSSGYNPRYYNFDTELSKYSPPGLPEKPCLVTWHLK